MIRNPLVLAVFLVVSSPAWAWTGAGHMTMAAVAYRQLAPDLRTRVDAILAHHPDVLEWDADRETQHSLLELGEYRFLKASTWPDEIERKPGWPNHASWHYANFPITGPESRVQPDPDASNDVLAGLTSTESTLANRHAGNEERAIALAYVIHLIGDIHQPLHCATAITKSLPAPKGDRGGNETLIVIGDKSPIKLHAFWDGLFGKDKKPSDAVGTAILLEREIDPRTVVTNGRERAWCLESWRLAQSVAYPSSTWATRDRPIPVDANYVKQAKQIGERQIFAGGLRLAAVLARLLKQ